MFEDVRSLLEVITVNEEIALLTGDLDADLQMTGQRLALADLIIAATALTRNADLSTRNVQHFARIPRLGVLSPSLL